MTDDTYLLSPSGVCPCCDDNAAETEIVQCRTCEKHYHAVCKNSEKATAICVGSFFPVYRRAKRGFGWMCDICLTKEEENKVSTMNDKFNTVTTQLDNLTTLVNNLTKLVTSKAAPNLDEIKQDLSSEINTRITQEFNQVKISIHEELTKLKTNDETSDVTPSTATVWGNQGKVKEIRTALLIKKDSASGKSVDLDKLEKTVIENRIPVNSIHVSDSGDTFVNLPNKSSSEKLQPLLKDSEPTNEIVTLKSKLPTIALLGVTREYDKPDIENMIIRQNAVIGTLVENGSELKVLYTKAPADGKPYHQVVLRVSPEVRHAISNCNNKVHMGRLVHTVVDRFYIRRCNICQAFGHYQDKCPTPRVPICGYCSDKHRSQDCTIKDGLKTSYNCYNCKAMDLDPRGHSTFFRNCPAYGEQQKKLKNTIDYDYKLN